MYIAPPIAKLKIMIGRSIKVLCVLTTQYLLELFELLFYSRVKCKPVLLYNVASSDNYIYFKYWGWYRGRIKNDSEQKWVTLRFHYELDDQPQCTSVKFNHDKSSFRPWDKTFWPGERYSNPKLNTANLAIQDSKTFAFNLTSKGYPEGEYKVHSS